MYYHYTLGCEQQFSRCFFELWMSKGKKGKAHDTEPISWKSLVCNPIASSTRRSTTNHPSFIDHYYRCDTDNYWFNRSSWLNCQSLSRSCTRHVSSTLRARDRQISDLILTFVGRGQSARWKLSSSWWQQMSLVPGKTIVPLDDPQASYARGNFGYRCAWCARATQGVWPVQSNITCPRIDCFILLITPYSQKYFASDRLLLVRLLLMT